MRAKIGSWDTLSKMNYFQETEEKADINISSSGDNTIIAAPGDGKYLAIDFIAMMPTTAVSVQLKSGSTSYGGPYPLDAKQSFTIENAVHYQGGIIKCANNEAFVINLDSAVQLGGYCRYRIINK